MNFQFLNHLFNGLLLAILYLVLFLVLIFWISFLKITFCDSPEDLPVLMEFNNLDKTESLKVAKDALFSLAGVYCIKCLTTGAMYIGSSVDLFSRIIDHFVYCSCSNTHLQYAIVKYGLAAFTFKVIELCSKEELIKREQIYLDWLFSLPSYLYYNINPTAGSRLGSKASEEAKANLSAALTGRTLSDEHKANMGSAKLGENNPRATAVIIRDIQGNLVASFTTRKDAGQYLGISPQYVSKLIKSGRVFRNNYRLSNEL
jgi:predicted GIY-YIG superfamily endonuclease